MNLRAQSNAANGHDVRVLADEATGALLTKNVDGVSVKLSAKTVYTLLNSVSANQTSAAQAAGRGRRTLQASIAGVGAVSASITFYGNNTDSNSGGVPLTNSFSLSGTTTATDGADCPAEWPFVYCVLADIAGTGAAVTCSVAV